MNESTTRRDCPAERAGIANDEDQKKPLGKRLLQLAACLLGVYLFVFVFTPAWVSQSKLHQDFMTAVEDLGVPTTATYYNDLPFINEAYIMLHDTWRFLPRDMADKQKRASKTQ